MTKKHISLKVNKTTIQNKYKTLITNTLKHYYDIIFLRRNTSLVGKDIALIMVLQELFKGDVNLARVKLIRLFIPALSKVKTINYDRLASGFDEGINKIRV